MTCDSTQVEPGIFTLLTGNLGCVLVDLPHGRGFPCGRWTDFVSMDALPRDITGHESVSGRRALFHDTRTLDLIRTVLFRLTIFRHIRAGSHACQLIWYCFGVCHAVVFIYCSGKTHEG